MQYPQIQFYRGSLVRLASGQLKQVEDLSSDDFVESARLASATSAFIESSVVRDFLEVSPIQPSSTSPASSTGSLRHQDQHLIYSMLPTSPSSSLHQASISPPIIMTQIASTATAAAASQTVLIKFFLETSRSVAFIEVPIEHPFFVFHRGWSSWNPQKTYDKFGLKCRKLKIGDTCISLNRRLMRQTSNNLNQHYESDQCNIMFSSIKIHE